MQAIISEEAHLRSAIMYEQAAMCYLQMSPVCQRRAAFTLLLAGQWPWARVTPSPSRRHAAMPSRHFNCTLLSLAWARPTHPDLARTKPARASVHGNGSSVVWCPSPCNGSSVVWCPCPSCNGSSVVVAPPINPHVVVRASIIGPSWSTCSLLRVDAATTNR
jgi:hypothetical protein